jgi:hypothetical protein
MPSAAIGDRIYWSPSRADSPAGRQTSGDATSEENNRCEIPRARTKRVLASCGTEGPLSRRTTALIGSDGSRRRRAPSARHRKRDAHSGESFAVGRRDADRHPRYFAGHDVLRRLEQHLDLVWYPGRCSRVGATPRKCPDKQDGNRSLRAVRGEPLGLESGLYSTAAAPTSPKNLPATCGMMKKPLSGSRLL